MLYTNVNHNHTDVVLFSSYRCGNNTLVVKKKISNRIKEFRGKETREELADRMNTTATSIYRLETGRTILNEDWLQRFAAAFKCEPSQLIEKKVLGSKRPTAVKVIGKAPGGALKQSIDLNEDDDCETIWFLSDVTTLAGIKVEGDSMDAAGIADGGIAIVDYSQTNPKDLDNCVVVIVCQGETTIKRLRLGPPLRLEPDSTNKEHQIIYFDGDKNWYIWGRVIHAQNPVK